MATNAITCVYLTFAVLLGAWTTNAKAVCFDKNGVSVDPAKGPAIPWATEFRESSMVLIGTVIAENKIPDPKEPDFWAGTLYTLNVEAQLKGKAGTSIQVFSPNDSGRMILASGRRYLLFLHQEGGRLTADACGNSARLVYPF